MSCFFQEVSMATAKKLGLSVLAVLAVLLVGGLAWAVTGGASGNKTRERNGNMTAMRGGFGGMHGILNATDLGLAADATSDEIKAAMEAKMTTERAAIDAAIAAGDYEAWKAAVGNNPRGNQLTSVITETNFVKYAEMEGYMTKARAIATELGLEGKGMGMGKGMGGRGCPGGKPPEEQTSEEVTE
jgi:hypothetical protein